MHINGFSDFCVPFTGNRKVLVEMVKEHIKFGYRNIAIEQTLDITDERKVPKVRDIFPEPEQLDFLDEFKKDIRVLSRLTIIYNDSIVNHYMTNSNNLKRFDIVAGMPMTDTALQHCCSQFNGDMVCFSLDKPHISFSRKYYNMAVERKMFFEILYAPAITDSNHRRNIIRRSHAYHSYGKSRNIILSSGAEKYIELRTPYEVANLGLLFGLSEEQGKCSMAGNCRKLLIRATGRRNNKAVMVVGVDNSGEQDDDEEEDDSEEELMRMDTTAQEQRSIDVEEQQPVKKKKLS